MDRALGLFSCPGIRSGIWDPSRRTPPRRDSSQNGIPPKTGFLPELEVIFFPGGIPFWEESCFGRNPVSGGVLWEESSLGGVPVGRDPGREEFRGRNHMGGVLYGRNPNGTILTMLLCTMSYTCSGKNSYAKPVLNKTKQISKIRD